MEESTELATILLGGPLSDGFSNDLIRLYLLQMAEIPLLSRQEELAFAKGVHHNRKEFWDLGLQTACVLEHAVETRKRVHNGALTHGKWPPRSGPVPRRIGRSSLPLPD